VSETIFAIVILAILVHWTWDSFLDILNLKHTQKNSKKGDPVPHMLKGQVEADILEKMAVYTIAKEKFSLVSRLFSTIFLVVLLASGLLNSLDLVFWNQASPDGWSGVFYCIAVSMIFTVFSLPFNIYGTFWLEERHGFNQTTPSIFVLDLVKSLLLSIAIGAPLMRLLFWLVEILGSNWWLGGWALIVLFQVLMLWLWPTLIAPLFNKFTPLEDEHLKEEVEKLAKQAGFKSKGVFLMDGSRRSSHSNAYFTGFGRSKRIVLFDTLLKQLDQQEILNVLAHELGHFKKKHIRNQIILSFFQMGVSFFLIDKILNWPDFFKAFGFEHNSLHAAMVLLSLTIPSFMFWLSPLFNSLSRRYEYQADRYAVKLLNQSEAMASALVKLARENLSNIFPHPLYSFFHYSHPTLLERIKRISS